MNPKYKQIGDFYFDLNKPIGQGAFATVFKAVDRKNRREAAVKVLSCGELLQNQDLQSFFMRELSVLHRIAGEHVVQLLDVKRTSNNLYLFTEFCDGGNLEDKLKARTYFSEEDACSIVKQIADAFVSLEDLHMMNTQGKRVTVMHRDIKPANILFHQDKVKVADFGFAKFIEQDDKNTQQTNTLLGTPLYMAPQVLNHEKFSTKCDVWSTGVVLYRVLFGTLPWSGYSVDSLYANIKTQPLTFPRKISEDTKDLLTRMLKVREEDRLSWTEVHEHPALNKKKSWEI